MLLLNKKKVVEDILVIKKNNKITTLEACIEYAEQYKIEIEVLASFLKSSKSPLHADLLSDGKKLNMIKKAKPRKKKVKQS